jgi:hypothetical protein
MLRKNDLISCIFLRFVNGHPDVCSSYRTSFTVGTAGQV